ncbi:MAG: radical SAM protein [Nitrospiraceae bacterium]|nr:radical SAM protein [Nitrospiraceae bacterium]
MDEFRIDSHKLMFHPREVARWLAGEEIFPIYLEISPSGACNHRCTFCALDFMEYQPRFLDTAVLRERISEMAGLGVKSIMYGGEGEPFLHRDIGDIIVYTKRSGIDVGITTNGVLFSRRLAEEIMTSVSWIKVSLNAGNAETYAKVHGTKAADFDRVMENLSAAVELNRKSRANCTLGVQMVLLPENAGTAEQLAETAKRIGLRYLVIKPYSQHLRSHTRRYAEVDYAGFSHLGDVLSRFNDDRFSVIFRERTMQKMKRTKRGYERCLALPFWAYIDSDGNVWGCSAFLGDEAFRYGSIREHTFEEIWRGQRRRQCMEMVATELDPEGCRMNCRMDEINLYLWELTHPSAHVNFI